MDFIRYQGKMYSWNSVYCLVDGAPWRALTSVEWSHKLEREEVYAATQDGVPIGTTDGQYSATLSLKMLAEQAEQFRLYLATLAPGVPPGNRGLPGSYGQTVFSFQLLIHEEVIGALPIDVLFPFCKINEEKQSHAKGAAAIETEFTCWAGQAILGNKTLFTPAFPF